MGFNSAFKGLKTELGTSRYCKLAETSDISQVLSRPLMEFAGLKEQLNGDWILLKCAAIMKCVSKTGYFILMEHNTVRYGTVTRSHAAVRPT